MLNQDLITIKDFYDLLKGKIELHLDDLTYQKLQNSYKFLHSKIIEGTIYGLNSGFGALADRKILLSNQKKLQINLIYHLATGVGERFNDEESLAILLARLISLSKGYSGISTLAFKSLVTFFQKKIIAHIPSIGTVGASGDLTPLAHLTLSYLGKSKIYFEGKEYIYKTFFEKTKFPILKLKGRDALAIVNGTSTSTALAVLSFLLLEKALQVSTFHSFVFSEIFELSSEFFNPLICKAKPHLGMKKISQELFQLCSTSKRISNQKIYESGKVQPPYSLRAVVQVLGSIVDFASYYKKIIEKELNSVSDNPLFFEKENTILHGANFYGSHIATACDGIKNLCFELANLIERRIAKITDEKMNGNLPAFLSGGQVGLDSGLMGAQVTASALLAEIRSLSVPCAILSIPTNANNQDIVPMATTSARTTKKTLELCLYLVSIEAVCISQAVSIIGVNQFSKKTQEYISFIQKHCKFIKSDRPLSTEIENLKNYFLSDELTLLELEFFD